MYIKLPFFQFANTLFFILVLHIALGIIFTSATANNLWLNPNFEDGLNHWEQSVDTGADATFDLDTTNPYEGSTALCVNVNALSGGQPWTIKLSRINIALDANETYELRFWAKGNAATGQNIHLAFAGSGGFFESTILQVSDTWEEYTFSFSTTDAITVSFNLDIGDELGTFCFDDFYFAASGGGTVNPVSNLDSLFATPTAAEIDEVLADWNSRDVNAYNWQTLGSGIINGFTVDAVSHEVAGNTHYGFVRHPANYDPSQSYAILMYNHGGIGGVNVGAINQFADDCYDDFFIIAPSFRGETAFTGALGLGDLLSDGAVSEFDGDVDDALALLNGTIANYGGVDATNISVTGGSRGGCVSYLVSIREARINRGVYFYGATDHITAPGLQDSIETILANGTSVGPYYTTVKNIAEAYEDGTLPLHTARLELIRRSPIHFLNYLPDNIQIHHGALDFVVPIFTSDELDAALIANNLPLGDYAYYIYPDGGHGNNMPMSSERQTEFLCTTPHILQATVFLEGAYQGSNLMHTDLATGNLLPITQPFNTAPWNYNGQVTANSFPSTTTDWLLVEIRAENTPSLIIEQRAALLSSNGTLLAPNGTTGLPFYNLDDGENYTLIIRSRNHLAIASANSISFPQATPYDFTQAANVLGGSSQLNPQTDGTYAMIAGDFNSDGVISVADFNYFQAELAAINQYYSSDVNLDGNVTVSDFNLYAPNASRIGVGVIRY